MAAGEGTAEATTAMLGITGTLETMGTLGTRGAQAATAPQETMEPQVAPGITETAKAMATRAEWATEVAEVAATRMRDKTILAAGETHQVREALRALDNRQAKEPRPAGAIQQVKERPQRRARRRARKQAMVSVSVSRHPL
jgi:hypothetical protein